MTDFLVLFVGAALPALVLVLWFRVLDRKRPEPLGRVGWSVLLGFVAAAPAAFLGILASLPAAYMSGPVALVWLAFVTAALVEEGVKYLFLRIQLKRNPHFDEVMDGIVYAASVSLGFAFAENLLYGLADRGALVIRAFTAVPMHAAATGIMGYWLGRAKREPEAAPAHARRGFLCAVLVHGLYDLFLFAGGAAALLSMAVLVWAVYRVVALARDARAQDEARAAV
ncbi:MAG: PrsW family intramembrane metalloprotease [Spirochaetia bacterium]|nr:PrsW family intramembrane metalloprotease [Spirochaetia bacterium]